MIMPTQIIYSERDILDQITPWASALFPLWGQVGIDNDNNSLLEPTEERQAC